MVPPVESKSLNKGMYMPANAVTAPVMEVMELMEQQEGVFLFLLPNMTLTHCLE